MGTDMITSISYSTDDGETWTTTNNTDNKREHLAIDVRVDQGDKVLWKGNATQTGYYDDDYRDYVGSFFSSDCGFNTYGNVMSLLYGDDFYNNKNLGNTEGTFAHLFSDYDGRKICVVVSAQNLILPATTLTTNCYQNMFRSCTSLTTAPVLPATTLVNSCYKYMFQGCSNLNYIKAMFTTTPSTTYTQNWVSGVASTGTFVKNSAAQWNVTGTYGIPSGWTVQTANE